VSDERTREYARRRYLEHRAEILERARMERRAKGIREQKPRGSDEERRQRKRQLERERRRRNRERDREKRNAQNRASYWRRRAHERERMLIYRRARGVRPRPPRKPRQIKLGLHRYPTKQQLNTDARKRYRLNPEPKRQRGRKWRRENPDRARALARTWVEANRLRVRASQRKRRMTPMGRAYQRRATIKRLHRMFRATPPWADTGAIEAFYAAAPAGSHVDHIIPIATRRGARTADGFLVCGLHCEANLQYLSARDNSMKQDQMRPWEQDFCEGRLTALPTAVELPPSPQLALDL
jgi:hypothetical protein